MSKKYIFVVGGVMSSVGKGIATASIGTILKSKGFRVTALKADPYVNVDAGTMNPTEHGEVFVTKDGDECDQDMGNYERFLGEDLTKMNYMTTGRIYQAVINQERNLKYDGKCVQVVPHVPEEIISRINASVKGTKSEIAIIEIGGTVGEYENLLFLEAARMMKLKNPKDVVFVLVSYLPIPAKVGEMKTKPTQHASRELNSCGIQADFILCRAENPIDERRREKLATFCSIDPENAISAPDVDCIYDIPVNFENEHFGQKILKKLGLRPRQKDLVEWRQFVSLAKSAKKEINIGIVGKYFETGNYVLSDSYISVIESVKIAAWTQGFSPKMVWLSSDEYETNPAKLKELSQLDGVIVPGGFGSRGIEGKISVAKYCRENKIPYFGLCYGMQIATIEFARNVCKLKDAHTEEINPETPYPVIHIMPEQKSKLRHKDYGGSMRLGEYACQLQKGTKADAAYRNSNFPISDDNIILERHRHRYEVNNDYREQLEKCGLVVAGVNPERDLVEIIEIKDHPFMIGTQFHPEFDSRPLRPQPLFKAFIKAAGKRHSSS
ncbi:CTP synthase [Candidatus Berkelbacteria bacterium CG10_big_fil_rev_8_21_14_0_10_43_13]|uniref:CTP synthase n=1 Tax=Candidatus Berkelbacteria bacterium CG10_big_fil_rev_8_21_14_0_10_43_13 TaxID=1974514 RepID=A0A2H0W5N6_9BACT|nr:MAG: CTP synthase [Candidatus Berkelbacteria bacterium CG10_big_fil_rev_8_21_14_0_10_43_13]